MGRHITLDYYLHDRYLHYVVKQPCSLEQESTWTGPKMDQRGNNAGKRRLFSSTPFHCAILDRRTLS